MHEGKGGYRCTVYTYRARRRRGRSSPWPTCRRWTSTRRSRRPCTTPPPRRTGRCWPPRGGRSGAPTRGRCRRSHYLFPEPSSVGIDRLAWQWRPGDHWSAWLHLHATEARAHTARLFIARSASANARRVESGDGAGVEWVREPAAAPVMARSAGDAWTYSRARPG